MQLQLETCSSGLQGQNELASTGKASTATVDQASQHWLQATWIAENGRQVAGDGKTELDAAPLELLFPGGR